MIIFFRVLFNLYLNVDLIYTQFFFYRLLKIYLQEMFKFTYTFYLFLFLGDLKLRHFIFSFMQNHNIIIEYES